MSRELGRMIQADETYVKLHEAEKNADNDAELQEFIKEFNLKKLALNVEIQKVEKDGEKIAELNKAMQHAYGNVMRNASMTAYNEAKTAYDQLTSRVMAIVQNSIAGEDPNTTDFSDSCTGSCSTCGGCG